MILPTGLTLRSYTHADAAVVRALHALAFRRLAAEHHDDAQIAAHEALIAAPDYGIDLARSHLLLAEYGPRLVATAGWLEQPGQPDTARIRKVFVHPDWARRGIASAMVRAAESAAAAAGRPHLVVRANINAVPLYEALGYRVESAGEMATASVPLPVRFMRK